MKCLVPVKRVIDFNVKIRVKPDGSGVETQNVKKGMNPFDEIALEEAVRQKEAHLISEIVTVSIGEPDIQETLRESLARGADKAMGIVINQDNELFKSGGALEPIHIAKILREIVHEEAIDLVIMGKQAIDDDCNQTGQMLSALLNWSQATNASKINFQQGSKNCEVIREVDNGLETVLITMPAVITVDLRLNEPRFISLPNIVKAKNKPLSIRALNDMKLDLKMHLKRLKTEEPDGARHTVFLDSAKALVDKLKNEAKILG